jgi:hypothetical protein
MVQHRYVKAPSALQAIIACNMTIMLVSSAHADACLHSYACAHGASGLTFMQAHAVAALTLDLALSATERTIVALPTSRVLTLLLLLNAAGKPLHQGAGGSRRLFVRPGCQRGARPRQDGCLGFGARHARARRIPPGHQGPHSLTTPSLRAGNRHTMNELQRQVDQAG